MTEDGALGVVKTGRSLVSFRGMVAVKLVASGSLLLFWWVDEHASTRSRVFMVYTSRATSETRADVVMTVCFRSVWPRRATLG